MFRIPLPFTDSSLLFTPLWSEWPLAAKAGAGLVCVVPYLLVIWLYRYELKLVRRSAACGLLSLRLLLLLVLLCVVTLQPILAHDRTQYQPGHILVAVDRSESMNVADSQRPAADKLRLARSLKAAGALCREEQLDE